MKKSLSLWSVHRLFEAGDLSLKGFIDFAKSIDAEGVEIVSFLLKDKLTEMKEVMQLLKDNNMSLAAYSIANDFAKERAEERQNMIEQIKEEINIAEQIGATTIRVFSSDFGNGLAFDEARGYIVEGLKIICSYAKDKNIKIAMENHGYFSGTSSQVLQILQDVDSDNLFTTLDIGNFILVDDDPKKAAEMLAKTAALVHVKDFHHVQSYYPAKAYKANSGEKYIGAVIGSGVIDVRHALKQLKNSGYDGYLTLEYDGGEQDTRENLKLGMDNLTAILEMLD